MNIIPAAALAAQLFHPPPLPLEGHPFAWDSLCHAAGSDEDFSTGSMHQD